MRQLTLCCLTVATLAIAAAGPAQAYIGPGAGISAIGTVIALLGAILLAVVGFVWYPIKRLRAKRRQAAKLEEGRQAS